MPTIEEAVSSSSEEETVSLSSEEETVSSASSSEEESGELEEQRAEPIVAPLDGGGKEKRGRNRPRVPSIEEVTEQDLFGDIDPPEPEPVKRSLKDQANDIIKQKDFHGAAALYTEALAKHDPDDPQRIMLLSNLALCMLKLKQWKECVDAASQALELDMDHTKALFRRGQARRELGELAAARSDLERSLETAPPNLAPAIRTALAEVNGKLAGTAGPALPPEYQPSETFDGPRDGYEFKKGPQGVGYYSTTGQQEDTDGGLSYEEIMERRKAEWKEKTERQGDSDDADDLSQREASTEDQFASASSEEQEAKWKTKVREGWSIVVSSAIPQLLAIAIWVAIVCAIAYLRREEILVGNRGLSSTTGFSLSTAFGGLLEVGTVASRTTAIGLVAGASAGGSVEQHLTVVATTNETLQVWEYTSGELADDLELRDEMKFYMQPEEEHLGPATAATVFSWPGLSSHEKVQGVANWAVTAGFENGEIRLYRGGVAKLRAQQRMDEYLPPTAQLQVLLMSSEKQRLMAIAAIAVDNDGQSSVESKSPPAYHLIAALAQHPDTCSESQQRQTCKQLLHVLSWEPEMGLTIIGTAVPPVGKSNTVALLTPFAAIHPGFLMLDVTGKMMTLSDVPRSAPEARNVEPAREDTAPNTAGDMEEPIPSKDGDDADEEEDFFEDELQPLASGVTLRIEVCTNGATPIPFGDSAGLSWAPDPLMPTNFYAMHSRGSRKVSLYQVRLDAIGDDHPGMCHSRSVQTIGTPEPPSRPLSRMCPMHGYLLGLGESVSLWNVTGSTGSGAHNRWPVLIGGSKAKSAGLSGTYSGVGKVLKESESCHAAIAGQHEWLLLQKPAGEQHEDSSKGMMGRDEYLDHLSEQGPITTRASRSSLVLVRSSLPFEYVTYDIRFMIYAVRQNLILNSRIYPLLCLLLGLVRV